MRILQITDTHLFPKPADVSGYGQLAGVDTRRSLSAVLDMALAADTPDLLLVTGDIAQDPHADTYAELQRQITERFSGDVVCLPGNHDEPQLAPELFLPRHWRRGDWQVLALDSHVAGEERGELAAEEITALHDALAASSAAHVLLAVHHPPLELATPLDHGRIKNGRELLHLAAADGRVRGIIFGHVHQAVRLEIGHLLLLGAPSTCVQFKPLTVRFALDTQPPGCRWITLQNDGSIASHIQRLDAGSFPSKLVPRQGNHSA